MLRPGIPAPQARGGGRSEIGRKLLRAFLCAMGALVAALALQAAGGLEALELASYDFRVRACPARFRPDPPIVLVLVDQKSLDFYAKESGRGWPWRRDIYGVMIEALREHGARAVAFDILFTEPSEEWPEDDEALASATAGPPAVYHAFDTALESAGERRLTDRGWAAVTKSSVAVDDRSDIPWRRVNQITPPIEAIAAAAAGVGSVHFERDADGPARAAELLTLHGGSFIPSLPLVLARDLLGGVPVSVDQRRVLRLGTRAVPLDDRGRMQVRFLGPERTLPSLSAASLVQDYVRSLAGEPAKSDWTPVRGAVVFVGTNLSMDLWKTPHQVSMPGVELQANALAGLLAGEAVTPSRPWVGSLLGGILAVLASIVLVVGRRPVLGGALAAVLGAAYCGLAVGAFATRGLWLPIALPLAALGAAIVVGSLESYAFEGRQRRFIRRAFEHYLAPQVIDAIVRDPRQLRLGGVRREITMYFSDLEGFTTLSERLEPEELVLVLNRYLSEMTRVILETDGTLDKYVGDAVVAFWGAPLVSTDHARRACLAALRGSRKLQEIAPELEKLGAGKLKARIGLNTGPAVVGNMGSTATFNYTAMGDTVNLASRLEAANKEYGSTILVAQSTCDAAGPGLVWRELDLLRVKGKEKAIRVHELMATEAEATEADRALVAIQEEALPLYRARDFEGAARAWRRALEVRAGDGPATVMLARCERFIAEPPPPGWTGEHVMHGK